MNNFTELSNRELLLELFAANDVLLLSMTNTRRYEDEFRIEARLHLSQVVAEMGKRLGQDKVAVQQTV